MQGCKRFLVARPSALVHLHVHPRSHASGRNSQVRGAKEAIAATGEPGGEVPQQVESWHSMTAVISVLLPGLLDVSRLSEKGPSNAGALSHAAVPEDGV